MTDEIRLLIVDDHVLVRDALAERLHREPGLVVVGAAGNADQAIDQTLACRPDIVLMDIDMPGLISFDAAKRIMAHRPHVRVIFLSAFKHDSYIAEALEAKAAGYLTKGEPLETVIAAIREVASGGAYFSDEIRSRIVVQQGGAALASKSKSRAATLTCRELEIVRYIARGLAKKEIAAITGISVKTVDRHSANVMAKLDIHDRVELARFAIREGIAQL